MLGPQFIIRLNDTRNAHLDQVYLEVQISAISYIDSIQEVEKAY